jgi:hypothetical protein
VQNKDQPQDVHLHFFQQQTFKNDNDWLKTPRFHAEKMGGGIISVESGEI